MNLEIRCKGKVQGVFFRATSKTMADDLSLVGWVKNETSGDVLMQVAGSEEAIKKMISWCKQGSEFARVDVVETKRIEKIEYEDFRIIY